MPLHKFTYINLVMWGHPFGREKTPTDLGSTPLFSRYGFNFEIKGFDVGGVNQKQGKLVRLAAMVLALAGLLPISGQAQQVDLGVAAQYSGFFFGNVSKIPDIEGRLAVGGNLTISGFSIGGRVPHGSGLPSLVVAGDLTSIGGGGIYDNYSHPGYAVYSGQRGVNVPTYIDFRQQAVSPIDFEAERIYLTLLSQQLRDMPATGTVSQLYSTVTLTGSNQDIEVFNLSASQVRSGLIWYWPMSNRLPTWCSMSVRTSSAG